MEVRSNNKACNKLVSKPVFRHFTGISFFKCPSNYYQESYAHWFDLSKLYQSGQIGFDLEDPNKNFEAFRFIENIQIDYKNNKLREINGR